jgi:Uncharacterized NAD(FAD)-dependent dehydrogenases
MEVVIIGGGAAGMSAASKAKRTAIDSRVTVVENGNFVSYAECGIPYYLSDKFENYENLIHYPIKEFTDKRGINVMTGKKVKSIDSNQKKVILEGGETLKFDKLVIATGASAVRSEYESLGNVFAVNTG